MKDLNDLKIYLLDWKQSMVNKWLLAFKAEDNVEVVCDDFVCFMEAHPEVDCIVSPANSFGKMSGGYDAAISRFLGWDFMDNVQKYIQEHYYGEQPVGSSFIIDTPKDNIRLIHTPTMRIPEKIKDDKIIYQCMRTTLICALENDVNCIVIPAFGGACGGVSEEIISIMMKRAYDQIKTRKSVSRL